MIHKTGLSNSDLLKKDAKIVKSNKYSIIISSVPIHINVSTIIDFMSYINNIIKSLLSVS